MKKLLSVSALVFLSTFLFAQDSTNTTVAPTKKKKDWSKVSLDQAGDHFMITLSSDH
ncbi:hypothetical protein BH11BAC3_BH11BAC3_40860 [soil metagenome]